jgi:acyl transferase domain-containing protein
VQSRQDRAVAFVLPGVGDHYVHMAYDLYQHELTFRATIDHCCELLQREGCDIRAVLYPDHDSHATAAPLPIAAPSTRRALFQRNSDRPSGSPLHQASLAHPAVFVVEYALAQTLYEWGVRPQALLGYSLGELVAACLAGVLSLEDALRLVTRRARLAQELTPGAMLAVALSETELRPLLDTTLDIAIVNGPNTCVIGGPREQVAEFEQRLGSMSIASRRLATSQAFHTAMLAPLVETMTQFVKTLALHPPLIPYISNLTGTWITAEEATDPVYWARHLCQTVRFDDGIATLLAGGDWAVVELGPGQTLTSFIKQHPACGPDRLPLVFGTLPHAHEGRDAQAALLDTLGQLWLAGVPIDWKGFYTHETRQRIPLPTYPFERQRYWIDSPRSGQRTSTRGSISKKEDMADWFYLPSWKRSAPPLAVVDPGEHWLVFADADLGEQLADLLVQSGALVTRVYAGIEWHRRQNGAYTINPRSLADYERLLAGLRTSGHLPRRIIHCWSIAASTPPASGDARLDQALARGFYSLLFLAQALGHQRVISQMDLIVLTNHLHAVAGSDVVYPEQATILGSCKVIAQEYPNIICRSIDVDLAPPGTRMTHILLRNLIAELFSAPNEPTVAYRDGYRWVQSYAAVRLQPSPDGAPRLRHGGIYLINGGFGYIGLALAAYLTRTVSAKVVLLGRSALPDRASWDAWLATHPPDNSTSIKIRKLQALEAQGAELLLLQADASNRDQMQAAIAKTIERFGALNGVVHAVGITGATNPISDTNPAECEEHFRAKARSVYILDEVLQGQPIDFCLLCSSVSAILGGLGFVAYSAVNLFLDAFATQKYQTDSVPWISVNWDSWQIEGDTGFSSGLGTTLADLSMTPDQGAQIFAWVVAQWGLPQIAVSIGDLHARIDQWVHLESLRLPGNTMQHNGGALHPRPLLGKPYVAPQTDEERVLVGIWQEVLGLEQVGITDNFFDLGGNSLVGLRVFSRVRDTFEIELSLRVLFDAPTIAELSQAIVTARKRDQNIQITPIRRQPRR